jgi:hypothetical protein
MNFEQTPEFSKELKKLGKKWRSLPSDLAVLQAVLATLYKGANGISAEHIRKTFFANKKGVVLQTISDEFEVVKVHLDCAALNKDMLRVTYIRTSNSVLLVELYPKNEKAREDAVRIKKYLRA